MITQREIYLDCNATHPLLPDVRRGLSEALLSEDAALANPASVHRRGQKAKKCVAELRDALCKTLGRGDGDEFILLSGATEAVNLSIRSFIHERTQNGGRVRLCAPTVEHSSIRDTVTQLGEKNPQVQTQFIEVTKNGQLDRAMLLKSVESAVAEGMDVLLCMQLCNNETGVSFDFDSFLPEIFQRFGQKPIMNQPKEKGGQYPKTPQRVWLLLDGAQALGKMDPAKTRHALHFADYMAICAHKMGGPAGIGALWIRPGAPFAVQITGGTQEKKRRAGTLNSIGALGYKLALDSWLANGEAWRARLRTMQTRLATELSKMAGVVVHGIGPKGDLPELANTLNFHVEGCPEESLLLALDLDGFCVSSGSACNSGSLKPSHVLTAMGYSRDEALASVRVCTGVETKDEDLAAFIESVRAKVAHIRAARAQSKSVLPEIK